MKPVLDTGLVKTHVYRNFPHSVVYGPKEEKGLDFSNIFLLKCLSNIQVIQQYINTPDSITSSFLCNSVEAIKVEIGVGHNLFTLNYDNYQTIATESSPLYLAFAVLTLSLCSLTVETSHEACFPIMRTTASQRIRFLD